MKRSRLILLSLLVLFATCKDFSTGWRTGIINKFSKKGFMYKTWEGEMNLGGLRKKEDKDGNTSFVANTWEFSIDASSHRNENAIAISDSITKAMNAGLTVKLHYNQERFTNINCHRGDTKYFIDSVKILY
jgi:hypothetical protein